MDAPRTRVTARRGAETKASFKTTEFMVFIVATVGVLLASYLVQATDGRGDYFLADKAWLYVVILSVGYMLRPESWTGLAGGSPVPVGTGAPGSRPRFVVETRRAERGVKSLFGGSKCAGRSVKRTLQPRHMYNGRAEPLMSRRRPCPANPGPGLVRRVSSGYGRRHVHTVWFETGETRLPGLRRAKTKGISRW
jgi:hypothetical protein